MNWFKDARLRGIPFPSDYLVVDVETSGLNKFGDDLIFQIGHAYVVDGQMVEDYGCDTAVLNWTKNANIDQDWLKNRIEATRHNISCQTGGTYKFTYDRLIQQGCDPIEVLKLYDDIFKTSKANNEYFLTHNGVAYDSHIIENNLERFLNSNFEFDVDHILDTGLLEKACQLDMRLERGESLLSFYRRVYNAYGKGITWSLSGHCIYKYDLVRRHHLDMKQAHDAGFDCKLTHLLFETYRKLAEED